MRAKKHGADEIGVLIDGFNEMLAQIQTHDESLRTARQQAQAADRMKSEFLANMSHELRTPLNAIIGFSEVIRDDICGADRTTKYRDYASDIHDSGRHLLDLINEILDLSKVESGDAEIQDEVVGTRELVDSAITLVKESGEIDSVELEIDLPDDAPALRADKRKLKQILVNLLANAIKFTPAGGKVTLRTWSSAESGYVFQITDTGIGIAPESIPKALSRFGQVDADLNRRYQGTGLGLPLTKALIEMHGGTLDLQSRVGIGTTVTVRFPAERIVGSPRGTKSINAENRKAG
jgi:signal transduction histidine kinase